VVLTQLEDKGLASRLATRPASFVATAPDVALGVLVSTREQELNLVRAEMDVLAQRWRQMRHTSEAHELVEIVTGREAIQQRFMQIQRGAQHDVLCFDKPPYATEAHHNAVEMELLGERQVKCRAIYDRTALEVPGKLPEIDFCLRSGEQARVMSGVPMKMVLADEAIAILPLRRDQVDAAIVVHRSSLVDALRSLFDTLWARALPLERAMLSVQGDDELNSGEDQLIRLLAAGLTDEAIARQLSCGYRTVQRRIAGIMERVGAINRLQLGIQLARNGWA
jgi:DNA-binding NarL/FixJ family response regulator